MDLKVILLNGINIDRDDKWVQEEMGRIGEERFRREHECELSYITKH